MTDNNKQDLMFKRIFDAPVEKVWEAWVEPAMVKQWWGPDIFTCPLAQIDFREGGTSLICMNAPNYGDLYNTWYYKKIIPMKQIEYISNLADKEGAIIDPASIGMPVDFPKDQLHTVSFKELGNGKTELILTECAWPPGQMMEMSRMGMLQCLDKMVRIIEGENYESKNF